MAFTPRQETLLKELGIGPLWKLRQPAVAETQAVARGGVDSPAVAEVAPVSAEPIASVAPAAEVLAAPCQTTASVSAPLVNLDWDGLTDAIHACRACGLCVKACPEHAITLSRNNP